MTAKLRIGILGAAKIAPGAVINPARERDDVEIACVAARDPARAEAYAAKHGIPATARDYAALITRDDVDLVYNALHPGVHREWTIRALEAGKAVLCEKPFAMSSAEATAMVDAGKRSGRPLIEAFHYRFHNVLKRAFAIAASGELGEIQRGEAIFDAPIAYSETELRWHAPLGGGALMDLGTYCVHVLRTTAACEPRVTKASCEMQRGVDVKTEAAFAFPNGFTATLATSMIPERFRAKLWVEGSKGSLEILNFLAPQMGCRFTVTVAGKERNEPVDGPSTYAAQLAHVVEVVRHGAAPLTGGSDAIANMATIDAVYRAAGVARS